MFSTNVTIKTITLLDFIASKTYSFFYNVFQHLTFNNRMQKTF